MACVWYETNSNQLRTFLHTVCEWRWHSPPQPLGLASITLSCLHSCPPVAGECAVASVGALCKPYFHRFQVSHDIRTPLNGLLGFVELVLLDEKTGRAVLELDHIAGLRLGIESGKVLLEVCATPDLLETGCCCGTHTLWIRN
jgi:phospho-acceptor domain-containing protein